ncbi:6980_t:CDS:2, partial [Funneliformis mosseae]
PSIKRSGAPLTDNEKSIVISIHNYFSWVSFKMEDHQKVTLRKCVAEALRISKSTVGVVVADWNKHGDNNFMPHKTLSRPKLQPDENVSKLLRVLHQLDFYYSQEERRNFLYESPNNIAF